MPLFKDDQILIIAPGSQTTLAQLGIPESLTPAQLRVRSRMFASGTADKWEPFKVRPKESTANGDGAKDEPRPDKEPEFYEDQDTEAGAVWPMKEGRIVNWSCFFGLLEYVYNRLGPGFHTPIFLVGQPCWTVKDHQHITQYVFEKFRPPAFSIVDSALCSMWAHKDLTNACVVDIGFEKADITAITDFCIHIASRQIAVPNCGGDAFTQRLYQLLAAKKFTRDMCEQLKKNAICEILPPGVPVPGSGEEGAEQVTNPAAAASTGATGSGPGHRNTAAALGQAPLGPGLGTENDGTKENEDNEGVLDIANIVASGNYKELIAKKDAEKAAKSKAGKGADAAAAAKPSRMRNAEREHATFMYSDNALLDALKDKNLSSQQMADAHAAVDEGRKQTASEKQATMEASGATSQAVAANGNAPTAVSGLRPGAAPSREIEVGTERFLAASGGAIDRIADAIQRAISGVEDVAKRGELWDNLVVVGNGAKIRGFRDALMAAIHSRYIISPSSATIFTSELPSNLTTPMGTGAQTPQPQLGPHGGPLMPGPSSNVNPLLLAATTQHLQPPGSQTPGAHGIHQQQNLHSSHGQTPTSVRYTKVGEYFPEWKDAGFDEAFFLGAQVACRVIFVVDAGQNKCFMTRSDYNELGPAGISEFAL
ncbi:hypothetical protein EJ08DRAFT_647905 [Tothia fuscella]|uniref:Actin-like ATPase domain-containing protein n=1 Tax=Tothia fuscella TaxID=1048955 RepID=A0A9P4U0I3_9PEZI|nr:hypothetical protein EJ08DRAFT_647905 [Tothia fuscella]